MTDYLNIKLSKDEILNISALGLAHLGDGVYELMVRTWLCMQGYSKSSRLHQLTVKHVSAVAQSAVVDKIQSLFTEEEYSIYKRGRNTRVNSVPSKATLSQYHSATGLETLFGWLYLNGRHDRLNELFSAAISEECV